ncbi:MAG: hypothetical protein JO362_22755 [Streptomycetaceae bacterium]|nr:hypothetical protein [Streptomycetaceae bacterium]
MTVHLSFIVVLGLVVWWLVRKGGLKPSHATVAILLGFYLKGTSLDPSITSLVQSAAHVISAVHL